MPTADAQSLRPAKRQSLGQTVADSLRDAVYTGRLQSGQRIGQVQVARELGVSQTTVREALTILEHEGLVDREANQGAVVRQLSRADIEEIVTLRSNLEAMAVRRLIAQANPEHVEALQQNIRTMQTTRGADQLAELDLDFHELLLRLTGHSRLLACWQSLRTQIKLLMVTHNLLNPRSARTTVENHKELLQLIKAGNADAAAEHLERGNLVYFMQATKEGAGQ
jgi:DNA-binding GntR family transcriptional regulator